MAGWVESLFHPANMGLTTAGPLKPLRVIEVGTRLNSIQQTLALFASQPPLALLLSHLPSMANVMPLPVIRR
jgi:hypothetical protein